MSEPQDTPPAENGAEPLARPRRTLWQRLGGEGLALSVLLHVLLVLIAIVWVVSTVTDGAGKKDPNLFATGAGGGAGGPKAKEYKTKVVPKNVKSLAKTNTRITSKNADSALAISSLPSLSNPLLTAGAIGGGASKGFGGGSGGGIGSGKGAGVGGGRNFVSMFGARGGAGSLDGMIGTFYDIKQSKDLKPTASMSGAGAVPAYRKVVQSFIDGGWSTSRFSGFYRAPDQLVSTQLWIPSQGADAAPKAFGVEKQVKPSRWVVHYRCMIEAPSSMPFRFVGSGDDWLIVRWDRKVALDDGYERVEVGGDNRYKDFGQTCTDEFKIDRRPGTLGRLRAGPWIRPVKGQQVAFEVLMGETPGGVFDMYLAIEPAKSETTKNGKFEGSGRLKLFRCGTGPLPAAVLNAKRGLDIDMSATDWIFKAKRDGAAGAVR